MQQGEENVERSVAKISKDVCAGNKKKKVSAKKLIMDSRVNKYLKKCKGKRERNEAKLAKVVSDIKSKRSSPKRKISPPRQSETKQDVEKLAAEKKKPTKKKTTTKMKNVAKKPKIICNHGGHFQFAPEYDWQYFTEDNDMFRTKCAKCGLKFGTLKDNPPTHYSPVWVCNNQTTIGCKHSYCGVCFYKKGQDMRDKFEGRSLRNRSK